MEKYEGGGGEHNEQRNVVARANLWVYLITKFALRREGLTMEASMLTVSLVNYDTVCLLLRYLHTGNFECNETTMFKLQTVSSIQSQFVRHETGWNERLLPIYLVEGKYELATSCEFLVTSREYDESRAVN